CWNLLGGLSHQYWETVTVEHLFAEIVTLGVDRPGGFLYIRADRHDGFLYICTGNLCT
ncbi:hypothetical protein GIB67_043272, partial [Kingdonia uniflora]